MESEYKYYRKPLLDEGRWSNRKPEQERLYDLVLIDIIDNKMTINEACRKNGVRSFQRVASEQRKLGLTVPTNNFETPKFDPNGIYKYWVAPFNCVEKQTIEYGKMMDVAIQMFIDGKTMKDISELFGVSASQFNISVTRCRKAGSPIPHTPARAWQTKRGGNTEARQDIFYFDNGQNKVKPHIILEWVDKRLQGYSTTWIANEYGVGQSTVSRYTLPLMKG
jgi:DNA-binding CsgD family transcriptional regulator